MGKRDMVRHETKKQKKDVKKAVVTSVEPLPVAPPVEVIGKKKKKRDEEFED